MNAPPINDEFSPKMQERIKWYWGFGAIPDMTGVRAIDLYDYFSGIAEKRGVACPYLEMERRKKAA